MGGMNVELVVVFAGLVVLGVVAGVVAWRRAARADRERGRRCACGYATEGITGEVCPECGIERAAGVALVERREKIRFAVVWTLACVLVSMAGSRMLNSMVPPIVDRDAYMTLGTPMGMVELNWVIRDELRHPMTERLTLKFADREVVLTPKELASVGAGGKNIDAAIAPIIERATGNAQAYRDDLTTFITQALSGQIPKAPVLNTGMLYRSISAGSGMSGGMRQRVPEWMFIAGGVVVWVGGFVGRMRRG